MPTLLVIDQDNPRGRFGALAVSALDYIKGAGAELPPGTVVQNIAADYAYMSRAYYVSLLAEARGHIPCPNVLDLLTCNSPGSITTKTKALPRLEARGRGSRNARTIGVLFTPADKFRASSRASVRDFTRCAMSFGLSVELFDRSGITDGVTAIAGLLVRDFTSPTNHAFRAALNAQAQGLPVIDDPQSIIRCSNKVFVQHLLERHAISTPKTLLVTPDIGMAEIVRELRLPVVLKVPDGSFSLGVHRANTIAEGERILAAIRVRSALAIAQEFMPTEYDWRIGMLAGEPLFACRYFMAPGHWQIGHHLSPKNRVDGEVTGVPLQDVPATVLDTARRAATLIGTGLYGVDIKQQGARTCVIEVNDNPDVDSEFEAGLPDAPVWPGIAEWFAKRLAAGERALAADAA